MRSVAFAVVGVVLFFAAAIGVRMLDADRADPGWTAPPGPTGSASAGTGQPTHASNETVTLVGAGDISSCESPGASTTAALIDGIDGTVFAAGDIAYESGSGAEFRDCYGPTWGRFQDRTLPAPGNHEYNTPGASGYFDYFGAAAGDAGRGWYATDRGAWRIIVLNSNCEAIGGCQAGSAEETWLRDDLLNNPRPCTLAIWHHPRFSSGLHGNDKMTADLWRALEDAKAEIIITGHDHDYERFAPQTVDGHSDLEGIVEFVVGTGGRSHYPIGRLVANSVIQNDTTFGVLKLELAPDSWTSSVPASRGPDIYRRQLGNVPLTVGAGFRRRPGAVPLDRATARPCDRATVNESTTRRYRLGTYAMTSSPSLPPPRVPARAPAPLALDQAVTASARAAESGRTPSRSSAPRMPEPSSATRPR